MSLNTAQPQQQYTASLRNKSRACLRASAAAVNDEISRRDRDSQSRLQAEVRRQRALIEGIQAGLSRVQAGQQLQQQEQQQLQEQQQEQQQEQHARIEGIQAGLSGVQEQQQEQQQEQHARIEGIQAGLSGVQEQQQEQHVLIEGMVTRSSKKKSMKKSKKKPSENIDKALQDKGRLKDFDPKCCKCRVWGNPGGTGSQCSKKATVDGCCKLHDGRRKAAPDGKWYYGYYDEKRPENLGDSGGLVPNPETVGKKIKWNMSHEAYLEASSQG
jgi:hypothetical protein